MMFGDPHFAYTYIRPVAVMMGVALGYWLINAFLDHRQRKREERERLARDVTPR